MTARPQASHEQAVLFGEAGGVRETDDDRAEQTRNSVLWAAYGDALGFISELVNEKGLLRRTQGAELDGLMAWRRRVGGRGGVRRRTSRRVLVR